MTAAEALLVELVEVLERRPELVTRVRSAIGGAASAPEWLTLEQAGQRAGVTGRVIRDANRRGELALGRAGRRPVVARAELDRWLASRSPASTGDLVADYEAMVG